MTTTRRHRLQQWFGSSGLIHPRRHVHLGLLGSVLIMVGSWGVGWLPPDQSSWFAHTTVLNPLRVELFGVISCAVLLILGALLLVRSWLRLGQDLGLPTLRPAVSADRRAQAEPDSAATPQKRPDESARSVLRRAMICWLTPLMFAFPVFSRDVYSYLVQGRALDAGLNPYEQGISSVSGWFMQGADTIWAESPSPYGPLFLLIARGLWVITGGVPEPAVLLFRAVTVLGLVLCWWAVPRLAKRFGSHPDWALWVAVLNPLCALYLIAGVHNDSLMIGLLLLGFLLIGPVGTRMASRRTHTSAAAAFGWSTLGLVLVSGSIAIKPLTVLALPFAGLLMLWRQPRRRSSWSAARPDRIRYRHRGMVWLWCLVVVGGVLVLTGWASGLWFGWIPAMMTSGNAAFPYAPFGLFGLGIGWVSDAMLHTGIRPIADIVYALGTVSAAGLVAVLALRRRVNNPLYSTGAVLLVAVLLAPIIQPWYLLWMLPLFAVVGVWFGRGGWQSWTLYLLVIALVIVGVVDQVSVSQWIPILLVRLITGAVGVAGMVFMVLIDPTTARLFPLRPSARQALRNARPPDSPDPTDPSAQPRETT